MKAILIPFLLIILASSCTPKDLPTVMQVTKSEVIFKCSHMTTEADLQKFSTVLRQIHGVDMDYSASSFLDTGTLQTFNSMLSKDGQQLAKISTDLMALQYKYYGYQITFEDGQILHLKAGSF